MRVRDLKPERLPSVIVGYVNVHPHAQHQDHARRNKMDLAEERVITYEQGKRLAQRLHASFVEIRSGLPSV